MTQDMYYAIRIYGKITRNKLTSAVFILDVYDKIGKLLRINTIFDIRNITDQSIRSKDF